MEQRGGVTVMRLALVFCLAVCVTITSPCSGALEFAAPFTDGCVLQRDVSVCVWGRAGVGEDVRVSFGGHSVMTKADAAGRWKATLPPMEACSSGRALSANEAVVRDVLVGEVWLCAGQSNAEMPLCGGNPRYRDRTGALVAAMTRRPDVRFASLSREPWCAAPRSTTTHKVVWKKFTPENPGRVDGFSALGVYFALELNTALDVPVGVLGAYRGSSPIEAWIPPNEFAHRMELDGYPAYPPVRPEKWNSSMTNAFVRYGGYQQPCVLWNACVAPLVPYTIKGVVWYQGCSNQWNADCYLELQHALYDGWSKAFGNPNLPFRFVQVDAWEWKGGSTIGVQLAQARFAEEEKNAAMAVVSDIGNRWDAHPNEKALVAKRLAALALSRDYGFTSIRAESPKPESWRVEGNKVVLKFGNAKTLYVYNQDNSLDSRFEVKGADGVWMAAEILNAETKGIRRGAFSSNEIILSAAGVKCPQGVRYLHRAPFTGNIFNEMNLPLGVFTSESGMLEKEASNE